METNYQLNLFCVAIIIIAHSIFTCSAFCSLSRSLFAVQTFATCEIDRISMTDSLCHHQIVRLLIYESLLLICPSSRSLISLLLPEHFFHVLVMYIL